AKKDSTIISDEIAARFDSEGPSPSTSTHRVVAGDGLLEVRAVVQDAEVDLQNVTLEPLHDVMVAIREPIDTGGDERGIGVLLLRESDDVAVAHLHDLADRE